MANYQAFPSFHHIKAEPEEHEEEDKAADEDPDHVDINIDSEGPQGSARGLVGHAHPRKGKKGKGKKKSKGRARDNDILGEMELQERRDLVTLKLHISVLNEIRVEARRERQRRIDERR
jgi:hypothetical protein